MGLNKGPFVVAQSFSVEDPYDVDAGAIDLNVMPQTVVATVDVCVNKPTKTQVSLDSMVQIAVMSSVRISSLPSQTFEVLIEILRNGKVLATINDEMDYEIAGEGRHTNFPNFPLVDNNPSAGINTYDLRCTLVSGMSASVFAASRSLKATVFTL
ncbi:hypothetical protein [Chengkuizengella sediminis]|uniref:hypothetical protein n=1 Tax=Chengkuizengella sediminis TaxID=1885917 RepID=UPI0013898857|nr:hypothetical protein [Chengkuizengella sediminis]NDI34900.1 hypothetical protein [Chengkuizengella sediminis]